MKKALIAFALAPPFLWGCTSSPPDPTSRSAQFAEYPRQLLETFEISCDGPGEQFRKTKSTQFECLSALPPDTTAYLILNYDGSTKALPKGIRRMSTQRNPAGYRVDAELFFLVPQKDGAPVKVPIESATLDQELTTLYRYFGGMPL